MMSEVFSPETRPSTLVVIRYACFRTRSISASTASSTRSEGSESMTSPVRLSKNFTTDTPDFRGELHFHRPADECRRIGELDLGPGRADVREVHRGTRDAAGCRGAADRNAGNRGDCHDEPFRS